MNVVWTARGEMVLEERRVSKLVPIRRLPCAWQRATARQRLSQEACNTKRWMKFPFVLTFYPRMK